MAGGRATGTSGGGRGLTVAAAGRVRWLWIKPRPAPAARAKIRDAAIHRSSRRLLGTSGTATVRTFLAGVSDDDAGGSSAVGIGGDGAVRTRCPAECAGRTTSRNRFS